MKKKLTTCKSATLTLSTAELWDLLDRFMPGIAEARKGATYTGIIPHGDGNFYELTALEFQFQFNDSEEVELK